MTIHDKVEEALGLIRPAIQMDGGDIHLVSVEGDTVTVRLLGTCETCPISPITLKQGVERILSERVPSITNVVALEA